MACLHNISGKLKFNNCAQLTIGRLVISAYLVLSTIQDLYHKLTNKHNHASLAVATTLILIRLQCFSTPTLVGTTNVLI